MSFTKPPLKKAKPRCGVCGQVKGHSKKVPKNAKRCWWCRQFKPARKRS